MPFEPVAAVLEIGGTAATQFHLINGVGASIPTALERVLAALPGIVVTNDVSVSVQSATESTPATSPGPRHRPDAAEAIFDQCPRAGARTPA